MSSLLSRHNLLTALPWISFFVVVAICSLIGGVIVVVIFVVVVLIVVDVVVVVVIVNAVADSSIETGSETWKQNVNKPSLHLIFLAYKQSLSTPSIMACQLFCQKYVKQSH